jgi:hypothetical protein
VLIGPLDENIGVLKTTWSLIWTRCSSTEEWNLRGKVHKNR